jgi:hypothetical protein
MLRNFTKLAAVVAIAAVMTPAMALAHGPGHDGSDDQNNGIQTQNQFGIHILGGNKMTDQAQENKANRDENEDRTAPENHKGLGLKNILKNWHKEFKTHYYNGTVTAVSSNQITLKTKDGSTLTVDASSAKIVRVPHTDMLVSDVKVGDTIHVVGMMNSNNTITANGIYIIPENLQPAMAKGTVTAINGSTLTVQTKDNTTVTVNTDDQTKITNSDHEAVTTANIEAGSKVKLFGWWDSLLNVFDAVMVRIK